MASLSDTAPARRGTRSWLRTALTLTGLALIVAGVLVVAVPLVRVWQRGQADEQALRDWNSGGSSKLAGPVGEPKDPAATTCAGGSAPAGDYALVTFPSLSRYGYAGVAGDGTWDMLSQRSMVHYRDTPAPGQGGNVIIAFHREPNFEHIDQLAVGDTVDVQDRSCHVWHYRVTQAWKLDPSQVTQLSQTGGHDLTLVTCTPWYVDSERLVWRATLTG